MKEFYLFSRKYEKFPFIIKYTYNLIYLFDCSLNCILLGGDVVNEKRYLWWNFVSSEMELIENAKKNWLNKKFKMPVDDYKDFIPLPN